MAFTYRLNYNAITPSKVIEQQLTYDCDGGVQILDEAISAADDQELSLAVPYAQIKFIYMLATVAMTIETNSSSAPTQSISLAANVPNCWISGGPGSNPITANITKIYVSAATAGTLNIQIGYDATP